MIRVSSSSLVGAHGHARAVVEQNIELMNLVGGSARFQTHQRMNAARVIADHAAQRVVRVGGRIGSEREVVLLGFAAKNVEHGPRLNPSQLAVGVDGDNLIEIFGPIHDDGHIAAASREARSATAREDGSAANTGDFNRLDHVIDVAGDDNSDGDLAVIRAVGSVEGPAAGIEPDLTVKGLPEL